jgi:flagellar biosynthesis/type III secretory pathway protein FliH
MILGLQASEKYDLLPVTELLASLVLKDQSDQEWIKRRFAMLQDALRETPAYQRILQEGREEGREEGLEEGLEKGFEKVREAQQKELQRQRAAFFEVVLERFPLLARRARDYAKTIDDPDKLSRLIVDMAIAPTAEEAERILQDVEKGDKETN